MKLSKITLCKKKFKKPVMLDVVGKRQLSSTDRLYHIKHIRLQRLKVCHKPGSVLFAV